MAKKSVATKKVYDNTNRGGIWVNNRVTYVKDEDGTERVTSPELTGTFDCEGTEYSIALWPVHSSNPKAPKYSFRVKMLKGAEDEETDKFVEGVAKAK
jgi:hypothetical protein